MMQELNPIMQDPTTSITGLLSRCCSFGRLPPNGTGAVARRVSNKAEPAQTAPADKIEVLARLPIFSELQQPRLEWLASHASWRSFEQGEVIIDLGDLSDNMFLLLEGEVRIAVRTPSGREFVLSDLHIGEFFGELAAIDGRPRSANATAIRRSRVCILPSAVFLEAAFTSRSVCRNLLRSLSYRMRGNTERLLELAALPVRHRLYAELLRLSRPRAASGERVVSPPPPHHLLAARIGAQREAVSRELSNLSRKNLVWANRRAIVLTRPAALRDAVNAALGYSTS